MKTIPSLQFRELIRYIEMFDINYDDILRGSMLKQFTNFLNTATGRKWLASHESEGYRQWQSR